ncbi:MAG: DUF4199 domain-containing protein [Aequorivita sp.]
MDSEINLQKFVLPFAFLLGLIRISIDIIPKTLSFSAIPYYSTFFIAFIVEIIFIVFIIKRFKKYNGILNLRQALKIGVILMLITGLLYTSTSYLYDTYIDPEFQINTAMSFVEKFAPDKIEETREQITISRENTSALGILTYTLWFVILGFIISLIAGSAMSTKVNIK